MPGRALALGPISPILADRSPRRAGSTLKLVTRAYMGVPLVRHCSHARPRIAFRSRTDNGRPSRGPSVPGYTRPVSCSLAPARRIRSETGMLPAAADVVIVGGGNAALCAALAAAEHGISVLVLERAPEEEAGGNSRFTAGAMRCVYDGVEDLKALMPDLTEQEIAQTDFGTYTEDQFFDDMYRVTEYRTDPELVEVLVKQSRPTLRWMRAKGVRFAPIWGRQAFKVEGKFKFWGGLTIESYGGGPGLVAALTAATKANGITLLYDSRAVGLVTDDDGVQGVRVRHGGKTGSIATRNVVLAAGGFQANAEWR